MSNLPEFDSIQQGVARLLAVLENIDIMLTGLYDLMEANSSVKPGKPAKLPTPPKG